MLLSLVFTWSKSHGTYIYSLQNRLLQPFVQIHLSLHLLQCAQPPKSVALFTAVLL